MKKVEVAIFWVLTHRFQLLKKIWAKNAENFYNASIIFQIFTTSKMKTRTQIFPKMDKKDFMQLKHI
jgi:hypothetical protein